MTKFTELDEILNYLSDHELSYNELRELALSIPKENIIDSSNGYYYYDFNAWTPNIARVIALYHDGIELEKEHWVIIARFRKYYVENGCIILRLKDYERYCKENNWIGPNDAKHAIASNLSKLFNAGSTRRPAAISGIPV